MIQAAHFDIKSVTGLRQALVLSAEYENEPFPLEGYTLHGSIGTYPRMDLKCSVDENGRARIEWDSVPPGNWKYDVFLISASNDETPLMEGTFTALPRITPVLDDESVNDEVGGVLHLPSGNEGTITLEVDGGFVSKEYAAIAKDAAEKAQQALEDIKQALQGVVTSIGGASGDILLDSGLKITGDREKGNVSLSLDDKTVVLTAGDQTIDGVKTFSSPPVIASAPASNNEAANKKYVDDMASKATGTTINGVSGKITLNLPMELDPDTKSMSVDLSGYASLQTDNVFEGNIYAESSFTANGGVNVYGSALFNSGVTASQSLTVGGHAQFNDTVRVETGKIDPGNFGHTWIFGSLIDSPTTADNNNHRLCCKSTSDNAAYILYHERVVNGAWMKDKIIPACQFDFSWHNDASIVVKDPTKAEQAANKNYVDSQFNCLSLSYMTLDTPQTVKAEKTFTGNVNINTNGNNGTLTLKTSGGVGYLVMDTGEFSISVDYLTLGGQTFVQTLNVAESSLFTGSVTVSQYLKTSSLDAENVEASTINLVDSYDLSCIDLMPFYGSPDEASLIFHPAQTGPGTTDYDIQLYFTYGSNGGFADWLAGPSIQMMRFHPAIGFYNAVSYSNPVVFLGSATFSALLKAQQAEIDQLKINSPLYEEGFLAWQDAGGLSMTRPSITESLYDADNPKAMLNREDNDQRYLQVKSLTAAEYAALGSYSLTTLYRITDADPAVVYLGTLKLSVAAD